MKPEVMLDLETLGTANNAAIVAIGAVLFDPYDSGAQAMQPFYQRVDLVSSFNAGLAIDPSTILWWMKQSDAARKSTFEGDTLPLNMALQSFAQWFGDDKPVWGNGATFDNVIIRSAFKAVDLPMPWKYWNDRCYRTMKEQVKFKAEPVGTAHNALDDAFAQAVHLQKIYKALSLIRE